MSHLKQNFGNRLHELRLAAEMTQEMLADEIGVTVESINNLEKIAAALDISVKELFEF